jgi:hypothetical protein
MKSGSIPASSRFGVTDTRGAANSIESPQFPVVPLATHGAEFG